MPTATLDHHHHAHKGRRGARTLVGSGPIYWGVRSSRPSGRPSAPPSPAQKSKTNLIPRHPFARMAPPGSSAEIPHSKETGCPPSISEDESAPHEDLVLVMIGTVTWRKKSPRNPCTLARDPILFLPARGAGATAPKNVNHWLQERTSRRRA